MLGVDPWAVLDDVHERHRVPAAEIVVLGQPGDHVAGDRAGPVESAGLRLVEQLPGGLPGLLLDRVEVCLKRDVISPVSVSGSERVAVLEQEDDRRREREEQERQGDP